MNGGLVTQYKSQRHVIELLERSNIFTSGYLEQPSKNFESITSFQAYLLVSKSCPYTIFYDTILIYFVMCSLKLFTRNIRFIGSPIHCTCNVFFIYSKDIKVRKGCRGPPPFINKILKAYFLMTYMYLNFKDRKFYYMLYLYILCLQELYVSSLCTCTCLRPLITFAYKKKLAYPVPHLMKSRIHPQTW